ncbi:oligopeptide ABC transport system permease OppB3 [Clostridium sp. CAG:221]|uniref:ABC transporter permease n=1 Tax=Clostridium sp. CAG:221 TaxID=1262780 RepID=UPI00033AA236|nr:ABC transporter permease [Clostridium sp. CAG:221]CDB16941.1 oligopeptide ABC transport system permease OppB3 [Clostridium sp. CAG:221]
MIKYIGKRFLQLIPILFGITFITFTMMNTTAVDTVDKLLENTGSVVSQEVEESMRNELGLDKPFLVQYGQWLLGIFKGDMGNSYVSGKDVFSTIISKLPNTFLLMASSILLTVIISIPLGIIAAVFQNKFIDYIIRVLSFIGNSLPGFFLALLLILLFSVKLKWLPIIASAGITNLKNLIMPTLTLSIAMICKYTRQVRAVVLEELNKDYVIAAYARGIGYKTVLFKSVFRCSIMTIITLLTLSIASLLGGTAIVETIFMWDGVGKLAIDSINMYDYPMIQAYVIWMAFIYVAINLISDIVHHYLDPRIRLGKE